MKKYKENIYNIPNALSLLRVILSPILVYLIYLNYNLLLLVILFIFTALTDFADGFIARKYNQVTNFGRKIDMIADRIFMISLVIAIFVYLFNNHLVNASNIGLIGILMTREVLSAPLFLIAVILNRRPLPHARFAGKLTTAFQGFAFPMILLGWKIAPFFALLTAIAGVICAGYYANDAIIHPNNKFQKKMDKYYLKKTWSHEKISRHNK